MEVFEIPIVLFSFKRIEKILIILDRISCIKPSKLYIISDGGRTQEEHFQVEKVRREIEMNITWECELVKRYSSHNIGVYENIAGGAKWVFEREDRAIFLEDDNLPELSFFPFCEELLERYKDDTRILWICGTNYLKEYEPVNGCSYLVTKNMMPCGWASWSSKFPKYYDGELELWKDPYIRKRVQSEPAYKPLMKQDVTNWDQELRRKRKNGKFASWDYQMSFTQRVHGMYAIVPKFNQITNIGVDSDSIHGGTSFDNEMTRRFCGLPTRSLEFPLIHPKALFIDHSFELKTAKIITLPRLMRFKIKLSGILKTIFCIDSDASFTDTLKKIFKKNEITK